MARKHTCCKQAFSLKFRLLSIQFTSEEFVCNRKMNTIAIWTKPLARRTLPRVCSSTIGRGKELIACSFPVLWTMSTLHGGCRENESATSGGGRYRSRTRESLYPHQLPLDSLEPSQSAPSHRTLPHRGTGRTSRPVSALRLSCHLL